MPPSKPPSTQPSAPPSTRRQPPVRTVLGFLPTTLALVAEGSWVAIVSALVQAASQEPIVLGPVALSLFAGAGLVAAREGGPRAGDRWPAVAVVLTGLAAAVGWLGSAATWDALLSPDPASALSVHPGGWLAGLAFLRGIAHARPVSSEAAVASLMTFAIPVIVAAFLLGGAIADPGRAEFRAAALADTVLFVGSGLLALALGRIRRLAGTTGFDWRRNPAWFGLLVVLVGAILLVALPASFAVGPLVILVIAALPVPLLVAGLVAGVDRRARRTAVIVAVGAVLVVVLVRLFGGSAGSTGGAGTSIPSQSTPPDQAWMAVAAWTAILAGSAILIALLSALWMRQALARGDDEVVEERTIDYGAETTTGTRRRSLLPRRRRADGPPTDAPEAYLAAVRELEAFDDLRRLAGETPAEHARRVRTTVPGPATPTVAEGTGGPGVTGGTGMPATAAGRVGLSTAGGPGLFGAALDLLAADYELARFGARMLTPGEHGRAIARWQRLRTRLRALPRGRSGSPDAGPGRPA
jgi:hypothetical protein